MSQVKARPVGAAETAGPETAGPLRPRRRRRPNRLGLTLLVAGGLLVLLPLAWMLGTSLKTPTETSDPLRFLPATPQWRNYPEALAAMNFVDALANTVFVTTLTVTGHVLSCSLVGFGFARFRFPGRGPLFIVMLATMMLPVQVTMIPVFLLFRTLGLVDSFWPLIIPAWFGAPLFIFLFRQFFSQVPEDLLEAARLDGASDWRIYWRIMLPMSWPVVAVVVIYSFLFAWNDFVMPLIYLNSPEKYTLQLALAGFSGRFSATKVHLMMAASIVTMLPCLVLFFAAQRYFISNELGSAVKG